MLVQKGLVLPLLREPLRACVCVSRRVRTRVNTGGCWSGCGFLFFKPSIFLCNHHGTPRTQKQHVLMKVRQPREVLGVLEVARVDVHRRGGQVRGRVGGQQHLTLIGVESVDVMKPVRTTSQSTHEQPHALTCIPFLSQSMRYCRSSRAGFRMPPSPSSMTRTTAPDAGALVDIDAACWLLLLLLSTEASTRPCCRSRRCCWGHWALSTPHDDDDADEKKAAAT